jgi:predicted CopG family antitoxin
MTKIISVSDIAYKELKTIKAEGESFSKVILRIVEKKKHKSVLDFFGKWPGSKHELEEIKENLEKERKSFKTRDLKFN